MPRCEMQLLLYKRAREPQSDSRVPDLLPVAGLAGRDGLVTEEMGLVDFQDSSFIEIKVLDHEI